jgi:hypothetical protein
MKMKRMNWMVVIVAALVLASFTLADAQPWRGKGQWPAWAANYYQWNWNPATVETLKGEVMTKDTITPSKGRSGMPAVGMTLKKEDDYAAYVHLGPQWYFDKQDLGINVGDKIEVIGSKITVEGNSVILVSSLKKGDRTWQFRDQQGFPFWSGRRW